MSLVFDARRRAEQARRARSEAGSAPPAALPPASEPQPDELERQNAATIAIAPVAGPLHWEMPASLVRSLLRAGSEARRRSGMGTWTPAQTFRSANVGSAAPVVRSLLRVPRREPESTEREGFSLAEEDWKIEPACLLFSKDPVYPADARQSMIAGNVELEFRISAEGNVYDVRPLDGPAPLAQAAIEAVETWRYEPARLNGKPVDSQATADFDFRLS